MPVPTTAAHHIDQWWNDAACRGLDGALFFGAEGRPPAELVQTCRACPCRWRCLAYALDAPEPIGFWGGWSERQRVRTFRRGRNPELREDVLRRAAREGARAAQIVSQRRGRLAVG